MAFHLAAAPEGERLSCASCPFGKRCTDTGRTARFADPTGEEIQLRGVCPVAYTQDHQTALRSWWAAFRRYEMGHKPLAGGTWDQPALFMEMMDLLDALSREERAAQEQAALERMQQGR